jgi:hypothetical protein
MLHHYVTITVHLRHIYVTFMTQCIALLTRKQDDALCYFD